MRCLVRCLIIGTFAAAGLVLLHNFLPEISSRIAEQVLAHNGFKAPTVQFSKIAAGEAKLVQLTFDLAAGGYIYRAAVKGLTVRYSLRLWELSYLQLEDAHLQLERLDGETDTPEGSELFDLPLPRKLSSYLPVERVEIKKMNLSTPWGSWQLSGNINRGEGVLRAEITELSHAGVAVRANAAVKDDGTLKLAIYSADAALQSAVVEFSGDLASDAGRLSGISGSCTANIGELMRMAEKLRRDDLLPEWAKYLHEVKLRGDLAVYQNNLRADLEFKFPAAVLIVENFKLSAAMRRRGGEWVVTLKQVQANLLGGVVKSQNVSIPTTSRDGLRMDVDISGIELQQLLKLHPQEQFEATGTIDGRLPVEVGAEGVEIRRGSLEAREQGGVIRYIGQGGTGSGDSPLQFALNALKNLHYSHLSAEADYSPGGNLELRVRIQGRNPDLNTERPIDVTVTIEENVPALLRSVRLAGSLGRHLEEQVRGVVK